MTIGNGTALAGPPDFYYPTKGLSVNSNRFFELLMTIGNGTALAGPPDFYYPTKGLSVNSNRIFELLISHPNLHSVKVGVELSLSPTCGMLKANPWCL